MGFPRHHDNHESWSHSLLGGFPGLVLCVPVQDAGKDRFSKYGSRQLPGIEPSWWALVSCESGMKFSLDHYGLLCLFPFAIFIQESYAPELGIVKPLDPLLSLKYGLFAFRIEYNRRR